MTSTTPRKKTRIAVATILVLLLGFVVTRLLLSGETEEKKKIADVPPAVPGKEYLKIGVLLPKTGADSDFGTSALAGLRVAEAEIRRQGEIANRELRLHILDTRSDDPLSIEMAGELINRAKVSLIIGVLSEEATLAVAEIARDKKIPFFYYSDGPPKTCQEKEPLKPSPYVWGFGSTQQMRIEPFLIQLAELFRKPESQFTFYYLSSDNPLEDRLSRLVVATAESLGFLTVGDVTIDARIRDHFRGIRTIFSHSPEILFLTFSRAGLSSFVPQAKKLGVQREMKIAAIASFNEETVMRLGNAADEILTTTHYVSDLDSPDNKKFLKSWKSINPEGPAFPTATAVLGGYSPLMIAAKAYRKADSIKAEKFSAAMRNIELKGPQGRIVVSASNHLLIQPLFSVVAKDGRFNLSNFLGDVSHPALESCAVEERIDEDEEMSSRSRSGRYRDER